MDKKGNKAITLIALVITIVVMLILAVVAINLTLGENGIFKRAKMAKEEQAKQAAIELLKVKMTECQLESIAEKGEYPTLAYLAAYLQNEKDKNGEIEYVEAVSKKVALLDETPYADWEKIYTKLSKYSFEFEIDSSFKVSVNGTEVSMPSGYMKIPTETLGITENGEHDVTNYAKVNVNVVSNGSTESTVINSFNIKNSTLSGLNTTISIDGTISTTDSSGVRGYTIIINDEVRYATTTLPYELKLERNTQNTIKVNAIDKNGNTKQSTNSVSVTTPNYIIQALAYPVLTTTGMKNIKYINPDNTSEFTYALDLSVDCTASDALDKKAYDGDETTYVDTSSGKTVFYFGSDINIYYPAFKTNATSGHLFDKVGGGGYVAVNGESAEYQGYRHTTYYGKNSTAWRDHKTAIGVRIYEIKYDTTIP